MCFSDCQGTSGAVRGSCWHPDHVGSHVLSRRLWRKEGSSVRERMAHSHLRTKAGIENQGTRGGQGWSRRHSLLELIYGGKYG